MDSKTFTFTEGGGDITPGVSITPTDEPTPTVDPSPVKLDMDVKFQGIIGKPAGSDKMSVVVKLAGGSLNSPQVASPKVLIADGNGTFKGTVGFNATAGSGHHLLIKGPRHLQKRVCASNPTESAPGSYHCTGGAITLALGGNPLNLSGIRLLVGDLPITTQDGVVDSKDAVYIRNNLGKTDADIRAAADLNQDGIVDSQDYSLVVASLHQVDEE
jgi:hypothetical protein